MDQPVDAEIPSEPLSRHEVLCRVAVWNVFQFEAALIAKKRALRPDVKALADLLWQDHAAFTERLLAAAGSELVPTSLDKVHLAYLDDLQEDGDEAFDTAYLSQQTRTVADVYALLRDYVQADEEGPLRSFCHYAVPLVARHGEMIGLLTA